ncbi:MAG: AAA family ATPase, partial [Bdellovibrio sp.]|nr:AAA family ATPase [Bdellovibrio sp.]
MDMFVGRQKELEELNRHYKQHSSQVIVIFGRRRIGKSTLVKRFIKGKQCLSFEGLENEKTPGQIRHFSNILKKQIPNILLQKVTFKTWEEIFDFLTEHFNNQHEKSVIFFDEFQWMAAGQSKLVALLKYYWDNHWINKNIMLILCGSIASFMVKKVIQSKALYGRVSGQIRLQKLSPAECALMLKRRGKEEVIDYLIVLSGVPKYIEQVDQSQSFEQNISRLFFQKDAIFADEMEKIFYSHFREPQIYLKIANKLLSGPKTMEELSRSLKIRSGGGLRLYLKNLELAEFIRAHCPFEKKDTSKLIKFRIADEFLHFYMRYVSPNRNLINNTGATQIFKNEISRKWLPWLGYAFENFCLNQAI